ncbi:MAG: hypothetical protein FWB99_06895 [Treponema sp.]|nr:hypothetical protein [Treponema sp.]
MIKTKLSLEPAGKSLLLILCFLCAPAALFAAPGTAAEIETLLASQAVTYAQASRFVLDAADVAAFADPHEAFRFAMEQNWLPANAAAEGLVRLDGVSLLFLRAFDIRGGVLFTLTGSPHFAYREMEFLGFIHGRASPGQRVSGETLLYLTGRLLARAEELAADGR